MEQSSRQRQPLFIPLVVLCECVWVLSRSYGQTRLEIARVLEQILETELFQVENDSLVRRSLDAFRTGRGDFADYLISEACREAGCEDCLTFGRGMAGAAGFTVLR
jgi:predicted nucleic-acid-binding protein